MKWFDPYSVRLTQRADGLLLSARLPDYSLFEPARVNISLVMQPQVYCLAPVSGRPFDLEVLLPPQSSIAQYFSGNACSSQRLMTLFSLILQLMHRARQEGFDPGCFLLDARFMFVTSALDSVRMVYVPVRTGGQAIIELRAFADSLSSRVASPTQEHIAFLQALNHRDATLDTVCAALDALSPVLRRAPGGRPRARLRENDASGFDMRADFSGGTTGERPARAPALNPTLPGSGRVERVHPYAPLFRRLQLVIAVAAGCVLLISALLLLPGLPAAEFFLLSAVFLLLMEAAWCAGYLITRSAPGAQMPIAPDRQASLSMVYREGLLSTPIPIDRTPYTIGRDPAQNVCVLSDAHISRRHACITYASGQYTLTDLNSAGHTRLNGRILPPNEPAVLVSGDIIAFCREEYQFIQP